MKQKHLAIAIASAFSLAGTAHAQQASGDTTASDAAGDPHKVTVTARRREELLQDVPGAVSAFSGDALEKIALPDLTGLADLIPNTTLKASRATNSTLTAFIRGVGQQDPVGGYEQGVGVYLDDVYLARPQGAVLDVYDVERIEVLRGPQGTLYGRNTIGGAIKYVTKKLSAKPELSIKTTLGTYGQADAVATASTPITDTLRVGGTFATLNRDGYGKNVITGQDNYNKDIAAGRFSVEAMPTRNLFIRFAADRTVDDSLPKVGYRLTPGPKGEPVLKDIYDTQAGLYSVNGKSQNVTTHGESLLLDYEISPSLSFKSITATRAGKSIAPIDFDSLAGVYMDAPAKYHDDQLSQEFQFTYTGDRIQGIAGLFYMNANTFHEFDVLLPNAGGIAAYTRGDIDTKTWAAFADVSYNVTNDFSVTLGGRFTDDSRNAEIFKATYLGLGSPTLGRPAAAIFGVPDTNQSKDDLERSDSKFTPKFGIGYKLSGDHNLYATYSEGFKGGMFDPRMGLGGNPNSPSSLIKRKGVDPEEIKSLEGGIKSRFMNGKVQTNIAAFISDYRNVQIPGSLPVDTNGDGVADNFVGTLTNAGKADIKGLEFEGLARVTNAFSLTGMLGYIDAEYKDWIINQGGKLVNVASAKHFQNTPKISANIGATYEWPLAMFSKSGNLALSNSLAYKSKIYQFEDPLPAFDQDAYTVWDASLIWTSKDRKILAGFHAKNLTDKHYKIAGYNFVGFSNTVTTFYGAPRTVSATVELRF